MSGPSQPAGSATAVTPASGTDSGAASAGTGAEPSTGTGSRAAAWRRAALRDLPVVLLYLLAAVYATSRLWLHRDRMVHMDNDQMLFEWMLARAARAVTHLENPLYSTALNAPDGVNLMANTSVLGLGIPLTPVTLLGGSQTTFLVGLVLSLAGTATAWYFFLSRRLVRSRVAAAVGGLFCGFAPGMISQAGGHLHMVAQFLVPAILAAVFHPRDDRVLRRGLLLGLLVAYQVFIGEEVLVFLVLAAGLFTVAYAVADPRTARRQAPALLGRLAVGAGTALVLLAYPLWFQFFGPGHYRGLPFSPEAYVLDVRSFTAAARQSVTGHDSVPGHLSPNPTEENSFFGLALIVLCVVIVIWQWRRPMVKALAVCGLVFAVLSFGPQVPFNGQPTDLPGPYRLVAHLPLLDLAVPARFPLICVPVIAILLALSLDRVFAAPRAAGAPAAPAPAGSAPAPAGAAPTGALPVRLLWSGAVAAALLPLVPVPIRTVPVWPVPDFVATGVWRSYVPPGRTIVPVPPTTGGEAKAGMYWSARTNLAFTAPGGYFIGPRGPEDPGARWGSPDLPTAVLLDRVAFTGEVPQITDVERRQAVEDLRHWRAAVVVQGGLTRGNPVKQTVDQLLGPGQWIANTWVWDVRDRVG
ncbi:hypothetical protein AB0J86_35395 [Micromonospora sp. NPDC049559]|uniref:hypothetical protein n=1 Tax=Micromonospora sp. NPDC049559 TaxID=3155923 RepID=UPI003438B9A5